MDDCVLCEGAVADSRLLRVETWSDDLWRLTTSVESAEVAGFSYLEPRRHISDVTALDGAEAATLGPVLQRCTAALKEATGCELVYVYVFGGSVDHLHLHLAPHVEGDGLNDVLITGPVTERVTSDGLVVQESAAFPPRPPEELAATAAAVRALLAR